MVSLGAWMIITPRRRAASTTWFMPGAMAPTRWAALAQVWVSHISMMTMAVCAASHRSVPSETTNLPPLPGGCSMRRRVRRLRVPGTFGRFGSGLGGGGDCARATPIMGRIARNNRRYIILLLRQQPLRKGPGESDTFEIDLFDPQLECRRFRLQPEITRFQGHEHRVRIHVAAGD